METYRNSQRLEENVIEILGAWSFLEAPKLEPTNKGTVNTTFFVEDKVGQFVLKIYDDSTKTQQICYEHSLLEYLQSCNLSFQVPTPIKTELGETLVTIDRDSSILRVSLIPFISGQSAKRENLHHVRIAGGGLGELHDALAGFDSEGKLSQLPNWGNLEHLHPLVTNPLEVPKIIKLDDISQKLIVESLAQILAATTNLYKTLPVQTTHADFLCPNILLKDNQLIGILDFEFATFDMRLLDFVAALDHFARPWKEVPVWEKLEAFSRGYAKYVTLLPSEVEALTLAWRLQQASCIVYWRGWLLEGKVTYQSVVDGVARMLQLENWLKENTTQLRSYFTQ